MSVTPASLPAILPSLLRLDWTGGVTVETTYLTDVTYSPFTLAEDRRALRGRPLRSVAGVVVGITSDDLGKLIAELWHASAERCPIPLYSDHARVTAASTGTKVFCDPTYRRFFPGGRVIVHGWTKRRPDDFQILTIASIAGDGLVTDAITGTIPEGARVIPLIDTDVAAGHSIELQTSRAGSARLMLREFPGPSCLDALVAAGSTAGFATYDSLPILTTRPNWETKPLITVGRIVNEFALGRAFQVSTNSPKPLWRYEIQYRSLSRASAWDLLKFFDGRRGRLLPFYFPSPSREFTPTAITTTALTVTRATDDENLLACVKRLLLVQTDGTLVVREVTWDTSGGENRALPDDDWPDIDLADIAKVVHLPLCRFDSDALTESWNTDEALDLKFVITEVPEVEQATIPNLEDE